MCGSHWHRRAGVPAVAESAARLRPERVNGRRPARSGGGRRRSSRGGRGPPPRLRHSRASERDTSSRTVPSRAAMSSASRPARTSSLFAARDSAKRKPASRSVSSLSDRSSTSATKVRTRAAEHANYPQGDLRMATTDAEYGIARQEEEAGGLGSDRGRDVASAVEHRDLSERRARPLDVQDLLASARRGAHQANAALHHDP